MAYRKFPPSSFLFLSFPPSFPNTPTKIKPPPSAGQYGQDVYTLRSTYIDGHPPPIHMHWRRFAVSSIPLATPEQFDAWLQQQWLEKDNILEHHAKTGRFPSALAGGEHITTEVRLGHWWELCNFFGLLLVLYVGCGFLAVRWWKG